MGKYFWFVVRFNEASLSSLCGSQLSWGVIALLLALLDGTYQYGFGHESSNARRILSGVSLGIELACLRCLYEPETRSHSTASDDEMQAGIAKVISLAGVRTKEGDVGMNAAPTLGWIRSKELWSQRRVNNVKLKAHQISRPKLADILIAAAAPALAYETFPVWVSLHFTPLAGFLSLLLPARSWRLLETGCMGQPVGEPALVQAELIFQLTEGFMTFLIAMIGLATFHLALLGYRRWRGRPCKFTFSSWSFLLAVACVATWTSAAIAILSAQ